LNENSGGACVSSTKMGVSDIILMHLKNLKVIRLKGKMVAAINYNL